MVGPKLKAGLGGLVCLVCGACLAFPVCLAFLDVRLADLEGDRSRSEVLQMILAPGKKK